MSWNPVLNKFLEIKQKYVERYGKESLWDYGQSTNLSCLEYWVERLGIKEYENLIQPLQFAEHDGKLLIRYANYAQLFGEDVDRTFDSFWEEFNGFYMECRSVVIDVKKDCLALTPFRKFRNLNECDETSLEQVSERIEHAKCVEFSNKLDGSMQSARWYEGKVLMSGSQAINPNNAWRLKDGYSMFYKNPGYLRMLKDFPDDTFIFEYISLEDAHVVQYREEQEGLYLIGKRNVHTGLESSYKEIREIARLYNIPVTEVFTTTLKEIVSNLGSRKSHEAEGFVANIDGFKIKIKYDDYVKMHGILSMLSAPNLIIKAIADDYFDDFYSKIPQAHRRKIDKITSKIFSYIKFMDDVTSSYVEPGPIYNKKEFMLYVDKEVPKFFRGYVREKYLGNNVNYLKSRSGHYKKMIEIERIVEEYKTLQDLQIGDEDYGRE